MSKFGKAENHYLNIDAESNQGDKDQDDGEPKHIWGPNDLKEDQINSSSAPKSGSGLLDTFFGLRVNKEEKKPEAQID